MLLGAKETFMFTMIKHWKAHQNNLRRDCKKNAITFVSPYCLWNRFNHRLKADVNKEVDIYIEILCETIKRLHC
ncbi:hypothetical protein PUN28_002560 [Cardiocondyla obscurior]|uniref:Transposase n=1 Tax=Cardiocondyla obscurior TaxID=286306 RepID=A0AAW2GUU9_9HYME